MIRARTHPTWVLLQTPLPETESPFILGCFVGMPDDPTSEIVPSALEDRKAMTKALEAQENSWTNKRSSFRSHVDGAKTTSVRAKLDQLFQFVRDKNRSHGLDIAADIVMTRKLTSHQVLFERLIQAPETRKALMQSLERHRGKVYMAVACRAFKAATMEMNGGVQTNTTVKAELPAQTVAEGMGLTGPAAQMIPNPSGETKRETTANFTSSQTFEDEYVYQIEYRVVKSKRWISFFEGSTGKVPELGGIANADWGAATFHETPGEVIYEDDEPLPQASEDRDDEPQESSVENDLILLHEELDDLYDPTTE